MTKAFETLPDGTLKVRSSGFSPPGCHPQGCGLFLHVKDGKVVKVEGDPDHIITDGRLCPRCLSLPEFIYNKDRITTPMKRDIRDRGKDKWTPCTWDEAMDTIVEWVLKIREESGPEYICTFQGTGRDVNMYHAPMAYGAIGTPNAASTLAGESCWGPRFCVSNFLLGGGYPEMDYSAYFPERFDDPNYSLPDYLVIWGKNPIYSNADGLFGHGTVDLMKRGTKLIVIDPRLTWLASRAEFHLQVRPGTDSALGLALLNVVMEEELYDKDFVKKWTYGFDDLRERAAEYPPEKAEEICWVPADKIRNAARAIASGKPTSWAWGQAIDGQLTGVQAGHCMIALAAICNNLDVPGGLTIPPKQGLWQEWLIRCMNSMPAEVWNKQIIDPVHIGYKQRHHSHPDSMLDAMETGEPYRFRIAWHMGTNPLACTGVQHKRWEAVFKKLEFNVVQDCVMTPSAMSFADLFLPVSSFAERDSVVLPHYGLNSCFVGAINKAIDLGCKSDMEIALMIGKRLNPELFPWESEKAFWDEFLMNELGITFDELNEVGAKQYPYTYKKYEKGLMRDDGRPGFNTPTGKVELKSSLYPDWNEDSLPYFKEPYLSPFGIDPETAEKYPIILTTGGRNIEFFHSEGRQIPSLRNLKPWPRVTIHPETAAKYGIEEGDWVCIENMLAQCIQKARLSYEVTPQLIHAEHGWWYPEQEGEAPNLYGTYKSNINMLIPHHVVGVMGWGSPYRGVICRIRKVDGLDDYDPDYPYEEFDVDPNYSLDKMALRRLAAKKEKGGVA